MAKVNLLNLKAEADTSGARTVPVPIKVGTYTDETDSDGKKMKVEKDFTFHLPASLGDAVKIEGEKAVFSRYVNSLVIAIQGLKRGELAPGGEEKKPRKRAAYMEALNI
jgi:hypothetical protein